MLIICQIDWREVGVAFEMQCFRNCTLSSLLNIVMVHKLLLLLDLYSSMSRLKHESVLSFCANCVIITE